MMETMLKIPRILIAGTNSGVGKTSISTGIMCLLANRGLQVQGFKVGPDYIDPTYHTIATGRTARNLDVWMTGEEIVRNLFVKNSFGSDISVIEGVMGLFDGQAGIDGFGSSAHIAKLTNTPVILLVDCQSMAQSAAALVKGFMEYDKNVCIVGVILNRVGSDRHEAIVREVIETKCKIPVLGVIKNGQIPSLPSRHLGLVPAIENEQLQTKIHELASSLQNCIDVEKVLQLANTNEFPSGLDDHSNSNAPKATEKIKVRIAIARDHVFSFYYQDSLDVLTDFGAELIPFSPVSDDTLPSNIQGILIGGGFPELFLNALEKQEHIRKQILEAGRKGMPIYAECGGLMYLSQSIRDVDGKEHKMVGLVPAKAIMKKRLVGLGYVEATPLLDNVLATTGASLKGHEFHYSELIPAYTDNFQNAYTLKGNKYNENGFPEGWSSSNILASYVHLHFAGNPTFAKRLIDKCRAFGDKANNGFIEEPRI